MVENGIDPAQYATLEVVAVIYVTPTVAEDDSMIHLALAAKRCLVDPAGKRA